MILLFLLWMAAHVSMLYIIGNHHIYPKKT